MDEDRSTAAAMAAFTQYLAQHKLRRTQERTTILREIFSMSDHFIIDELCRRLDRNKLGVSRATVYNTIELLCDCGLVRRHTFGNNTAQYERVSGAVTHHHLICTHCGKVKEIKDIGLNDMLRSRHFSGFTPEYACLYLYGKCSRCSRKEKRKEN